MYPITAPISSLLVNGVHRFAACYRLTRKDGTILRFTNHNAPLVVGSETFTPVDGVSVSARRAKENLESQSVEFLGVLSGSAVTEADLLRGKYEQARVDEFVVDWKYPFKGKFFATTYWITSPKYSGEQWEAEVIGFVVRLRQRRGNVITRTCRFELGGTDCGVTLSAYSVTEDVDSIVTANIKITTGLTTQVSGYFDDGVLTWTSGNNNGLKSVIKKHVKSTGSLEFQLATPYAIQVGDTFSITPGCNHLSGIFDATGHCKNKFNNINNFGGFPFTPGNDKGFQTPNAEIANEG